MSAIHCVALAIQRSLSRTDKLDSMMTESFSQPLARLTYSIAEVEAVTGLSRTGLYRLMARGELQTVKRGGRRLVPRGELERLCSADPAQGAA
jgi:excisionase family DNA binding protein